MKRAFKETSDDVTSPPGIEQMLRQHLGRLYEATSDSPSGPGLRALSGELLTEPILPWAVTTIATRLPVETGIASEGHDFNGWYVAVTVCADLNPMDAAARMPGGYLAHMNAVTAPAWPHPAGRNVAHWIYCCDGEVAGVHLTMIPNPHLPKTSPPLIAQDFLTETERRQLNVASAG